VIWFACGIPFGIAVATFEVRAAPPSAANATTAIFRFMDISSSENPERRTRSVVAVPPKFGRRFNLAEYSFRFRRFAAGAKVQDSFIASS
jgi:hypothetical protein